MRLLKTLLLITIALTAGGTAFAVQVERDLVSKSAPPVLSTMQSGGVSLGQAVEQVRRQCNGRIVSAETQRKGNHETHVIKCLTQDGKVRTFRIPGKRTG
jgi:hypothetical protein